MTTDASPLNPFTGLSFRQMLGTDVYALPDDDRLPFASACLDRVTEVVTMSSDDQRDRRVLLLLATAQNALLLHGMDAGAPPTCSPARRRCCWRPRMPTVVARWTSRTPTATARRGGC